MCGDNGAFYITTDAGTTWANLDLSSNTDLQTIYSLNTSEIWIVGSNEIFSTSDFWMNWQNTSLTGAVELNSICFINASEGWFCGDGGLLRHTTDGGITWGVQTTPYPDDYTKIQLLDGSIGYIISAVGRIMYSSDGGTWLEQHLSNNALRDLEMLNYQKGVLVGDNGEFLYTENSGSSWLQHPDILSEDLKGVSFYADSSLCAVGNNGIVYVSKFKWALEDDSTQADTLNDQINISFPTAFSPNNDGMNDKFIIDGIQDYGQNIFTVFNRWGDVVYHLNNYNNGEEVWSGESNYGAQLEAGTYFYVFETANKSVFKADWVQIVK